MRFRAFFPVLVAPALSVWALAPLVSPVACSGGTAGPLGDAAADAFVQPLTTMCTGDATRCLSGTVATQGMTAKMTVAGASLFRVYPYGAAQPIQKPQLVAKDGTWAFSGLDPWAHYYVQIAAGFPGD